MSESFGSVCSGIEAASVAWHPLGWRAAWFAEIEKFPSAVIAHHYPEVVNHGDMRNLVRLILRGEVEAPGVFTGGTPCQAFSVAGKRESLADARGNLSMTFCEIADAIDHVRTARGEQPCIIKWENVPGVLSTRDNAFGCFLGALAGSGCELQPPGGRWPNAGCVYGPKRAIAWRVLDAQYFGLAQRRKRVFVVGSARNGFDPARVLFESDSLRRDSAPRRQAGQDATGGAGVGAGGRWPADVASTLNAAFGDKQGLEDQHALSGAPLFVPVPVAFSSKDHGGDASTDLAPTLRAMGHADSHANAGGQVAVAFHHNAQACQLPGPETDTSASASLTCSQQAAVATGMAVRRLTPRECERLQGFPDDYTRIPWRGKPAEQCPHGPRYKALGNSWAVPCARWIGARIAEALA